MEGQEWTGQSDLHDGETTKHSRWSEHCKTFLIRDAHGAVKELVFPRALDLDRPKRERTIFSSRQLGCLEEEFKQNQYLVGKERSAVAKQLGLSETQVKVWFQNRRTKHKKDNELCGEGKDFQAESKAARNVLKLLEYKTALSYSSFLSQPPTQLDAFRNISSNSMDILTHPSPIVTNDDKEQILKQHDDKLDHSPGHIKDAEFSVLLPITRSQTTTKNVLSITDMITNDISIDMAPKSSSVGSSTESFQNSSDALLHQGIDRYNETEMEIMQTHGGMKGSSFKAADFVKNRRFQTDNSYSVDKLLNHADLQTDSTASGDLSQDDSTNPDECILQVIDKCHEEILSRVHNKRQENREVPQASTRFHPYPGLTHPVMEPSHETWRHEGQACNSNTTPRRPPPLEACILENRPWVDHRPVLGTTSTMPTSRDIQTGMFPTSFNNRSIGNYFSNLMNCPSNINNAYLSYQPLIVTQGQGSLNLNLPHAKHYNYYVPSFYDPEGNDTSTRLQILQHAPVGNTYVDGQEKRSYSSYTMNTPQVSFLSPSTVHGLPSHYHGYHVGPPFT